MLAGTVPGVVLGAVLRVLVVPDARTFRLIAGAVLVPLGLWLLWRTLRRDTGASPPRETGGRAITTLSLIVGTVGGLYGIGGGSLLSPILVGRGMTVARVAPAALLSTLITSIVGALAFVALAVGRDGSIAPDWGIGIAAGLGGLAGGYCGARWGTLIPERALRVLLGSLAALIGVTYILLAGY